jgi:hypothetical protein
MSRKPLTIKQIDRKLAAGFGSGQGMDYKPFLIVQNVASSTLVTRIRGLKIRRVYHLFSFLEVACFHIFDACKWIVDIREQVPLTTLNHTLYIANKLHIVHPGLYKGGKTPQMMTTDFLVDVLLDGEVRLIAICVKPSALLGDKRVKEKLELERFYWLEMGIEWRIVTEKDIPMALVRNLQWLYSTRNWFNEKALYHPDTIMSVEMLLLEKLNDSVSPLSITALNVDQKLRYKPGTTLEIFRYLVAQGYWKVDMLTPIDTAKPIRVTKCMEYEVGESDGHRYCG